MKLFEVTIYDHISFVIGREIIQGDSYSEVQRLAEARYPNAGRFAIHQKF